MITYLEVDSASWEDVAFPCKYIKERYIALKGQWPLKSQIIDVFNQLLEVISEIFQEEKFRTSLTAISHNLLKDREKRDDINKSFLDSMSETGIKKEDISVMSDKLFSIDIDQIIINLKYETYFLWWRWYGDG